MIRVRNRASNIIPQYIENEFSNSNKAYENNY